MRACVRARARDTAVIELSRPMPVTLSNIHIQTSQTPTGVGHLHFWVLHDGCDLANFAL